MAGDVVYDRQMAGSRRLLDLGQLQDSFQLLLSQAHPEHLAAFFYWLDLKVAQFKVFGSCLSQGTADIYSVKKHDSAERAHGHMAVNGSSNGLYQYEAYEMHGERNGTVAASEDSQTAAGGDSIANMPPLCSVHELANTADNDVNAKHVVKSLLRAMLAKPRPSTTSDISRSEHDSSSDGGTGTPDHSLAAKAPRDDVATETDVPADAVARDNDDAVAHGNGVKMESESELPATAQGWPAASSTVLSSPEKVSRCPYCLKVFRYRSSYRRHVKIHEGVFSHECSVCLRKFTRKEHYVRHKCDRRPNKPYNVTHDVYRRVTANQKQAARHVTSKPVREPLRQSVRAVVKASPASQVPLELTTSNQLDVSRSLFTGGTVCQPPPPAERSMDTSYSLCSPLNISTSAWSQRADDRAGQYSSYETSSGGAGQQCDNHGAGYVDAGGDNHRTAAAAADIIALQHSESRRKSSTPRKVVATADDGNQTIDGTIESSPSDACRLNGATRLGSASSVPLSVMD